MPKPKVKTKKSKVKERRGWAIVDKNSGRMKFITLHKEIALWEIEGDEILQISISPLSKSSKAK